MYFEVPGRQCLQPINTLDLEKPKKPFTRYLGTQARPANGQLHLESRGQIGITLHIFQKCAGSQYKEPRPRT